MIFGYLLQLMHNFLFIYYHLNFEYLIYLIVDYREREVLIVHLAFVINRDTIRYMGHVIGFKYDHILKYRLHYDFRTKNISQSINEKYSTVYTAAISTIFNKAQKEHTSF
ncbi:hypothetical protein ACJX0J_041918, partial [Zea mays]